MTLIATHRLKEGEVPWTGPQFEQRHHHGLTAPIAAEAARQASAILRSGAPERIAIATANKRADRLMAERHRADGGVTPIPLNLPGWPGYGWDPMRAARDAGMTEGEIADRDQKAARTLQSWRDSGYPIEPPGHADGGTLGKALHVLRRQMGGGMMPEVPFFERAEAYGLRRGFIGGTGSGRFDKNATDLPSSSYILPADIISGLGEGNSLSGARVVDEMLHSMPDGIVPPRPGGRHEMPRPPRDPELEQGLFEGTNRAPIPPEIAKGGTPGDGEKAEKKVSILDADGEFRLLPFDVAKIGAYYWPSNKPRPTWEEALKRGSSVLDSFVREERGRNIKEIKALRGPKGSRDAGEGHNPKAKGPEK